jgi:sugar-specific transcriptional regulator TrmB
MENESIFKRLGYPKHSSAVYETLVSLAKPQSLAMVALSTNLPRMTVYRVLVPLTRDKLVVTSVVGKRTFYTAAHPSVLALLLKKNEQVTDAVLSKLTRAREKDVPTHVRFLYGKEGIREAFDDVVEHTPRGATIFRYTSEKNVDQVNAYLSPDYRTKRDAKKLERMVISNPVSKAQKRNRLERFIRTIPEGAAVFDQDIIQFIYGNRVSFIDIAREQVTIIEDKKLVAFQKVIFEQLYKKLDRE